MRARRNYRRAWLACTFLACSFALVLYFRGDITAQFQSAASSRNTPPSQGKADLTFNGSVLFVPFHGNLCHERVLDNATWKIRDDRIVDCQLAAAQNAQEWKKRMAAQRVNAIRESLATK